MKKKILLFTAIAGMTTLVLTSGQTGAGFESGYNATGSETGLGNINGCKASGCHGTTATTGITVALELDSAGFSKHYYIGGHTYTVKITGTNTTTDSLPRFGFQVSCITGSSAVTTPTNAGAFATTGLPANVRFTPAHPSSPAEFVCNLIEHSTPIPATTGSGRAGTTYVESFTWTAPAAGTGTISFWGALNAVNFNGAVTGDFWNTTKLVITEGPGSVASVVTTIDNINIKAFPNPVINNLHLQFDNAQSGNYSLQVFDVSGKNIARENIEVNSNSQPADINTGNWAPGMYIVVIEKEGSRQVIPVVKK